MSSLLAAAFRSQHNKYTASDIHTTAVNMCRATLQFSEGVRVTMFAISPINFGAMPYGELCTMCVHLQAYGTYLGLHSDEFITARNIEIGPVASFPGYTLDTLEDMRRSMSAVVAGIGARSRVTGKNNEKMLGYIALTFADREITCPSESYSEARYRDVPVLVFITEDMSTSISIQTAREDILYAQIQGSYDSHYLNEHIIYGVPHSAWIRRKYFYTTLWYRAVLWALTRWKMPELSRIVRATPYTPVILTYDTEDDELKQPTNYRGMK